MEIKKLTRYAAAGFTVICVFAIVAYLYGAVRDAQGSFGVVLENTVLAGVSFYLLFFLVLYLLETMEIPEEQLKF